MKLNLLSEEAFREECKFTHAENNELREVLVFYLLRDKNIHATIGEEILKREGRRIAEIKWQLKRRVPESRVWHNSRLNIIFATLQKDEQPPFELIPVLSRVRSLQSGQSTSFHYEESQGYFINPYQLQQKLNDQSIKLSFHRQGNYCHVTAN